MFGVKFENDKIMIVEKGNESELLKQGYDTLDNYEFAKTRGMVLERKALRKEFLSFSIDELDSDRAKEIEKRIWGCLEDYTPGMHIEHRKSNLQNTKCE